MTTECAQIISNCFTLEELKSAPKTLKGEYRKHSYPHHPCCKWAQESLDNYSYVLRLGLALANECEFRGFVRPYSAKFLDWASDICMPLEFMGPLSPPLCMPDKYKIGGPIESYREFYRKDKIFMANGKRMDFWTKRNRPEWL